MVKHTPACCRYRLRGWVHYPWQPEDEGATIAAGGATGSASTAAYKALAAQHVHSYMYTVTCMRCR